jgi:ubiquinone/menaquinone biosynthesis C-methylase UbiE
VLAIDPNAASIARAKQLTPAFLREKVRFRVGTAEQIALPGEGFEIALLSNSL